MPNILDIRRRIRSVRNTRQITKAMKMVSAARLRRAQERALAARPYGQMITNILKSAARFIQSNVGKRIDIETVGRKGREYFRRRYKVVPWSAGAEGGTP